MAEDRSDQREVRFMTEEDLKDEHFAWVIDQRVEHGPDFPYVPFEDWLAQQGIVIEGEASEAEVKAQDRNVSTGPTTRWGKYPWHLWTDGDWWEAEQGREFECSVGSFRSYLYNYAGERGLKVETSRRGRGSKRVSFRFSTPEAE